VPDKLVLTVPTRVYAVLCWCETYLTYVSYMLAVILPQKAALLTSCLWSLLVGTMVRQLDAVPQAQLYELLMTLLSAGRASRSW